MRIRCWSAVLGVVALLFCASPPAVAAPLSVWLNPVSGPPGTSVTVSGKGYNTCPDYGSRTVDVLFDGFGTGVTAPIRADGTFSAAMTVPTEATTGDHLVYGRCQDGGEYATATFTVTAAPQSDPVITLRPQTGRPATQVTVRGTGFTACQDNRVEILWDESTTGAAAVSADGTFTATFSVPRNASVTNHRVVAQCPGGDYAHAAFRVNPGQAAPTTTSPPVVTTTTPPTTSSETTSAPPTTTSGQDVVTTTPTSGWPEPEFVTSMPTASQVLDSAAALFPWGILLVIAVWLLVGWPAELFNNTYKKNEPTIRRWLGLRGERKPARPTAWPLVLLFAAIAACLLTWVQAGPGVGRADIAQALGYLIAIPLVAISYEFAIETHYRNGPAGGIARLRIVVPALVVAVVCAVVSRWLDFVPGYVYGLLIAYNDIKARDSDPLRVRAAGVLRGVVLLFALACGAWVLWQFGTHPATAGDATSLPLRVLDTALVQIAVLSMETLAIGLIPIDFLHGGLLRKWSRRVWFAVYLPAALLFVLLLLGPQQTLQREGSRSVDVLKSIWLFVGFCAGSFLFWGFFKWRNRQSHAQPDLTRR
ncbi:hypothetical protein SAMN04488074_101340 [Lentzea albidocapillata subsp. violacea]|uniref:IPT/TIG domain-containing protein n=1 Tax=Lentzea albidocapillata subsp. violacea TaxID=128104 RepID=A0A1G8QGD7_9PSEU|nr:FGLLP motif-containing membrane protein [Lentzea albidocapillata]SDJ03751.1 hypothetical protein SAMN04488074_101340 [Lentzea albidocapillata subsp. violacea]